MADDAPDFQLVGPYTMVNTGPVHVISVVADRVVVARLRYPGRAIWRGWEMVVALESLIEGLGWPWCVATRFSLNHLREVTWFDGGDQAWIEYETNGHKRRVMTCIAPNDFPGFAHWWETCRPDCQGLETLPVRAAELYRTTLSILLVMLLVNLVIACIPVGLRPGWLPMFHFLFNGVAGPSFVVAFLSANNQYKTYWTKHRLRFG